MHKLNIAANLNKKKVADEFDKINNAIANMARLCLTVVGGQTWNAYDNDNSET